MTWDPLDSFLRRYLDPAIGQIDRKRGLGRLLPAPIGLPSSDAEPPPTWPDTRPNYWQDPCHRSVTGMPWTGQPEYGPGWTQDARCACDTSGMGALETDGGTVVEMKPAPVIFAPPQRYAGSDADTGDPRAVAVVVRHFEAERRAGEVLPWEPCDLAVLHAINEDVQPTPWLADDLRTRELTCTSPVRHAQESLTLWERAHDLLPLNEAARTGTPNLATRRHIRRFQVWWNEGGNSPTWTHLPSGIAGSFLRQDGVIDRATIDALSHATAAGTEGSEPDDPEWWSVNDVPCPSENRRAEGDLPLRPGEPSDPNRIAAVQATLWHWCAKAAPSFGTPVREQDITGRMNLHTRRSIRRFQEELNDHASGSTLRDDGVLDDPTESAILASVPPWKDDDFEPDDPAWMQASLPGEVDTDAGRAGGGGFHGGAGGSRGVGGWRGGCAPRRSAPWGAGGSAGWGSASACPGAPPWCFGEGSAGTRGRPVLGCASAAVSGATGILPWCGAPSDSCDVGTAEKYPWCAGPRGEREPPLGVIEGASAALAGATGTVSKADAFRLLSGASAALAGATGTSPSCDPLCETCDVGAAEMGERHLPQHRHRCPRCGHTWWHATNRIRPRSEQYRLHVCPMCGEREVWAKDPLGRTCRPPWVAPAEASGPDERFRERAGAPCPRASHSIPACSDPRWRRALAAHRALVAQLRARPDIRAWVMGIGVALARGVPTIVVGYRPGTSPPRLPRTFLGVPVLVERRAVARALGASDTGGLFDTLLPSDGETLPWAGPMELFPDALLGPPARPSSDAPPCAVSPGRGWSRTARGTWVYNPSAAGPASLSSAFADETGDPLDDGSANDPPWASASPRRR